MQFRIIFVVLKVMSECKLIVQSDYSEYVFIFGNFIVL